MDRTAFHFCLHGDCKCFSPSSVHREHHSKATRTHAKTEKDCKPLWITASVKSHQQFLSFFGLKDDEVGFYVHVNVAAVVVDVSVLAHYPDVVISQGYPLQTAYTVMIHSYGRMKQ